MLPLTAIVCIITLTIENGMVSYSPDDTPPYSISTTALYKCNAGFSLVGEATSLCVDENDQANTAGVWTGTPPLCLRKV